jgi:hypothetical protein
MKRAAAPGWQAKLSRRIAIAACPARDRPWVEALFAELDAVDGSWNRLAWIMGAARLVASSGEQRLKSAMKGRTRLPLLFALLAAILSAFMARIDSEALRIDDDWFIVSTVLFVLICCVNLTRTLIRAIAPAARKPS